MKFIDFFSGVGGFTHGMELAGHECVGHCEIDRFAEASYRSMHLITDAQREYLLSMPLQRRQKEILKDEYLNGDWYSNDIQSVQPDELPRAECWCFGFPCQDISISGKRKGFTSGERSSLFFTVMHLASELKEEDRPKWLFIENVKNLLSINKGFDFARLLVEMDKGGMTQNGECLTVNTSEFLNTENECSLSDILEQDADEKYYLSQEATNRLLSYKDRQLERLQHAPGRVWRTEHMLLKVNSFHKE